MPRVGVYLLIPGVGRNPRGILTVGHPPKGHNLDDCYLLESQRPLKASVIQDVSGLLNLGIGFPSFLYMAERIRLPS